MDIILLLVGLVLILGGANYLTDGASALAQRLRMPEFLIGLTIVAVGTSMPEMVVSVLSSINGQSDMAIGNVVGSNIFNVFMVLGLCAIIHPIAFTKENTRVDIPLCVLVSALFVLMTWDTLTGWGESNTISRIDGAIMLALYIGLMYWTIRTAKRPEKDENAPKPMAWWLTIVMIVGGLCGLIFGGDLFLSSATSIARKMGISE
ncbi:MAG: sodium:calcium antiporter, partial [Alistipes sp.]|nr:sodium:calcium antiporter [Alistipes sp.]